jgi:hypothetical protein
VEDTVARKAEANLLIRLVDNELIANIQDVPPGILGVTRVHRRRGGRVQKHTSFVVTRLRNWRTSPCSHPLFDDSCVKRLGPGSSYRHDLTGPTSAPFLWTGSQPLDQIAVRTT